MLVIPISKALADPSVDRSRITEMMLDLYELISTLRKAEKKSGYQFEKLINLTTT